MEWKSIKLKDLIYKPISGEWGKEITNKEDENIVKVIRTANFTNKGIIDYEDIVLRNISVKKVEQKRLLYGDILVEKSGGTDKYPVGRIVFYDKKDDIYLSNNFTTIFRAKKDKIYNRFLFYYLFYNYNRGGMIKYYNKTTGIQNLKVNDLIKELQIPVPPMEIQKQIVEVLDEAQKLIDNRKKQIKLLDNLIESIFYDMFGDPVKNDKGWEVDSIRNNVSNRIENINSDYSSAISYIDISSIDNNKNKIIGYTNYESLENAPSRAKKVLKFNDVILSTVRPNLNNVALFNIETKNKAIGSTGFCILRPKNKLNSIFLFYIAKSKSVTDNLVNIAKGASYPAVNDSDIKNINIGVPPIGLQNQFAEKVQAIEKQKELLQESLKLMEDNYNSLMQRAFKGQLF